MQCALRFQVLILMDAAAMLPIQREEEMEITALWNLKDPLPPLIDAIDLFLLK